MDLECRVLLGTDDLRPRVAIGGPPVGLDPDALILHGPLQPLRKIPALTGIGGRSASCKVASNSLLANPVSFQASPER